MLTNTRYENIASAATLEEMLVYDGVEFVYCAYRTLLGRDPDQEGASYYLSRLESGVNKLQIIDQLCSSPEMKQERRALPGLEYAMLHWRRSRWPLVGKLFGPSDVGRYIGAEQKLQRVENSLAVLSSETATHLNQVNARLSHTQELLEQLREIVNLQMRQSRYALHGGGPVLGRTNERFVFNLSTSHHWRAQPVGIVRVERELAKYLADYENVRFALWDPAAKVLRELDRRHVDNILSERWCDNTDTSVAQYHHGTLPQLELSGADTFVSIGIDWDLSPIHDIAKYLRKYRVKMVGCCYDLVPILFPEFSARQEMAQTFRRHFVDMAHTATQVLAISNTSRKDLINFWEEAGVETHFPDVHVIPLAAPARGAGLPQLNEKDVDTLRHVLYHGKYVLYVSSLEARKNHRLLVNVWRELYRDRGADCPQLIFVGMKGWGIDDMLHQIGRMPVFKNHSKIVWLQGVSDALLAHLYANCLFTVFPSMYEGWGLAA
ncbi:DUF4214 domain-containing protein, partial [Burkholderia singularis]|uniref:DUF4214 domain-containing protein n=1 Tax=Burkholderia singularis TaxID=1503053 RepID=UPI0011801563